ncbi:MAG: DEAD/DEAH box helicase [Thaumarchaeota archaeon]|nr:DEAD/DEAH box helicase [Nitrososphaerota archaeon]
MTRREGGAEKQHRRRQQQPTPPPRPPRGPGRGRRQTPGAQQKPPPPPPPRQQPPPPPASKKRQGHPGQEEDRAAILERTFAEFGFESLTEIQSKASPVILQKRDCLAVAPTGSGKTECSIIPIFSILGSENSGSGGRGGIRALYITPLRALNRDVFRRISRYAELCGLEIGVRHGDTPQGRRRKMAENPPDVMITTPETLVVLLSQEKMLAALASLEWVVIDEVHELLASERGSQLSLSLERLELNSKRPLTRIGLSATVGNVSDAAKFVSGARRRCRIVRDRSLRKYDVDIEYVEGTISDAARAIHAKIAQSGLDSPVLLFANTRGEAEFLASVLKEIGKTPVELHHGSLSKSAREETEQLLREGGGLRIIACTSSLELGIDVGSVELVVHYGSPRQVSKFVQRIGRSRHVRGASARGLIITNSADDELEARAIMERVGAGSIEQQRIHAAPLDVLAHHMVGLSMQAGPRGIRVDAALDVVRRAYPYRDITIDEFSQVLEQLDASRLITYDRDGMTFEKSGRYMRYHYENLSTIPDMLRFKVFDSTNRRIIGTLDQRFVGDHGEQGNIFVLRGSQWRILNVDEKSFAVNVEPLRSGGGDPATRTVPYWEGESIPVDYETARRVGLLRGMIRSGRMEVQNKVMGGLTFEVAASGDGGGDRGSNGDGGKNGSKNGKTAAAPPDIIPVESQRSRGVIVLHGCFGSSINATLSTLLSSMLSGLTGSRIDSRSDGYRIVLSSSSARISEPLLLRVLGDRYDDLAGMVGSSLAGTHNVNWRVWCVAKRFGVLGRDAVYESRSARFLYERHAGTPVVREALRELFHDKYDLDGCRSVLEGVRSGRIRVSWTEVDGFSGLAAPILDHTARYYSSPAALDRGIIELVKARLAKTKHRIVCVRCGRWERLVETRDVVGPLACPHCRGRQVAVTFHSDTDLPGIVRKRVAGQRVTAEEKRKFERAWKVASLIESFGPTAVTVMSGYGVGADTAARILRNMIGGDEDNLIKQIYEAERQYVVTRGFWD